MTALARQPGWAEHSDGLARFARTALFVRLDAFGEFGPGKRGVTVKSPVTEEVLVAHFRGDRCLGAHSTSTANESLFGALDLDEDENPSNLEVAQQIAQRLRDQGFAVLVEESRPNRFHLWIRFEEPVLTGLLYGLLQSMAHEAVTLGLREPETFPKQAMLVASNGDGPFGNWLRLPGRHPEFDWWSRIFDAETDSWLEGADAAQAILEWRASSPSALPAVAEKPVQTISTTSASSAETIPTDGEPIPEGTRNNTLTRMAGGMRRVGFSTAEIESALQRTNHERCRPPLPDREIITVSRSIGRYEPAIQVGEASAVQPADSRIVPIEFLDLAGYSEGGIPEIEWLADGWIANRDIEVVAGTAGIGKSTTLGGCAYSLSTESQFCGIPTAGPMRVLYFDEEMGETDTARLFLRFGPLSSNLRVASCQGIRLDTKDGIERLGNAIADWGARIVFGDSVQQLFGSADENSAQEVGAIYRSLFKLRDSLDVTIVLAHHKRKDSSNQRSEKIELVRGSTAHSTQASCVIYASPGEGSRLNLVQVKRRGAPKLSLSVRYDEAADGSILLTGEGAVDTELLALEKAKEWVLDWLTDRGEQKTKDIKDAAMGASIPGRTVQRALTQMRESGEVEQPRYGHYRNCAKGPETEVS